MPINDSQTHIVVYLNAGELPPDAVREGEECSIALWSGNHEEIDLSIGTWTRRDDEWHIRVSVPVNVRIHPLVNTQ